MFHMYEVVRSFLKIPESLGGLNSGEFAKVYLAL